MGYFDNFMADARTVATQALPFMKADTARIVSAVSQATATPSKGEGFFKDAVSRASGIARAAGVRVPLDRDIAALEAKAKVLKGVSLQASAAYHLMADRPNAPTATLAPLRARIMAAQSRASRTQSTLLQAASAGRQAQSAILSSPKAGAQATALFLAKQKVAMTLGNMHENELRMLIAECGSLQRQLFGTSPSLIKGAAQASYATAREFGGTVSRGLVAAGNAGQAAITGAEQYSGLAKYAVPVGIGVLALYAISLLPRPRSN